MNIKVLLKLCELKKQEISSLGNDFRNLENIVIDLESKLNDQIICIKEFIQDYANNEACSDNPISILNGRIYLQNLNAKNKDLEKNKLEAEIQKEAAFESLKESVQELRKFTKIITKEYGLAMEVKNKNELLIDDTLEIYRYNDKVS